MSDLAQLSQLFNLLYHRHVMDFVKGFLILTNFDQTTNKYGFVFWLFLYFTDNGEIAAVKLKLSEHKLKNIIPVTTVRFRSQSSPFDH